MSACERCWRDAGLDAALHGGDKVDHYHRLLEERRDSPCTPEEQCGELHAVIEWKDGTRRCCCGLRREDLPAREGARSDRFLRRTREGGA